MSGISSISSGTSGTSSSLPNGGLSSVGESLLTSGAAPNPVPAAAAPTTTNTPSTYQTQYQNLISYDNQELLYASFLDPQDALANADSVFLQAAALLGSPGHPGTLQTTPTAPAVTASSSTSSSSNATNGLPSVASILAASDDEANQTLAAFANAPAGASIVDYQA